MKDQSLHYFFSEKCLYVFEKYYEKVVDIQSLYDSSAIDRVKKQATITKKFSITCIITLFITLGVFLSFIIPSTLPLGMTTVLVSSLSLFLVFFTLSLGAGIVFYHLHKKNDIFLEKPNSPFIERVLIKTTLLGQFFNTQKYKVYSCILDISTLDKNGNGICLAYYDVHHTKCEKKNFTTTSFLNAIEHRVSSVFAVLVLPLVSLCSVIYNIIRLICAPIYVLSCLMHQYIHKEVQETRREPQFELVDVALEMVASLKRIVKAPFYATAMFFALVYSLIYVRSGRIVVGILERNWNENVYISSGFQQAFAHKHWEWEGGCRPKQLGRNGYYIMGCVQPRYIFSMKNWKILEGKSMLNTTSREKFLEIANNSIYIIKRRKC